MRLDCAAPKHWSKYTTSVVSKAPVSYVNYCLFPASKQFIILNWHWPSEVSLNQTDSDLFMKTKLIVYFQLPEGHEIIQI